MGNCKKVLQTVRQETLAKKCDIKQKGNYAQDSLMAYN